jgi:hypothetical protein
LDPQLASRETAGGFLISYFCRMEEEINTFWVEDAMLTASGWMLIGEVEGDISTGNYLAFDNGFAPVVKELKHLANTGQAGVIIPHPFLTKQDLIDQNIIGATAQIIE